MNSTHTKIDRWTVRWGFVHCTDRDSPDHYYLKYGFVWRTVLDTSGKGWTSYKFHVGQIIPCDEVDKAFRFLRMDHVMLGTQGMYLRKKQEMK